MQMARNALLVARMSPEVEKMCGASDPTGTAAVCPESDLAHHLSSVRVLTEVC